MPVPAKPAPAKPAPTWRVLNGAEFDSKTKPYKTQPLSNKNSLPQLKGLCSAMCRGDTSKPAGCWGWTATNPKYGKGSCKLYDKTAAQKASFRTVGDRVYSQVLTE